MVGAGLLARNAVARGLHVSPTVKTSLAPGSKAVTGYLEKADLMRPLAALGFSLAGYGCTTCIGNSGPLAEPVATAIEVGRADRRRGPVGQPQLRGPDPSAGAGLVPRLAAAGRRVRPGRPGRRRPDQGAAGHRRRRSTGHADRHLADPGGGARGHRRLDRPRAVPRDLCLGVRGRRALDRPADPVGRPIRVGPGLDVHREAAVLRGPDRRTGAADATSTAPACWRSSAIGDDGPHQPGRARSPPGRPPASGSRPTASGRSSSTPTAPAAATTR